MRRGAVSTAAVLIRERTRNALDRMENVPFFDHPAPVPEFARTPPRREPWRGTPDDTLGIPIEFAEILAQTDEVAVLVSGLIAFSSTLGFSLILISRLNPSRVPFHAVGHHPGIAEPGGEFRFGIGLADGTKVFGDRRWLSDSSEGYTLRPQGGGGGGRSWRQGFLLEPLPPPGPLQFVCEWPAYGLSESRLELDATIILEAAKRAKPLWPDDIGLPEPPIAQQAPRATTGLTTGSTTRAIRASHPQPLPPNDESL